MAGKRVSMGGLTRRSVVWGGVGAAAAGLSLRNARHSAAATTVSVLCALPPNYAPPGVGGYGGDLVAAWLSANNAWINYEPVAWENLPGKIAVSARSASRMHDLVTTTGWIPQFAEAFRPLDERLDRRLRLDLAADALRTTTWDDELLGIPANLSLLTLFYNAGQFQGAGIAAPPATWDELKRTAAELTRDGRYGWRMNLANPSGIGGTASYWMTFLQQAGGRLYGDDGRPRFDDEPGILALQLMIDLLPSTDPRSFADTSIVDTTLGLRDGSCAMAMNWPFMWKSVQDDPGARYRGQMGTALLPAGPAGTASLDGSDAWSIRSNSPIPDLAMSLIGLYLDRRVQKALALSTDWLPARLSVLADKDVRAAAPHAATVLAQAQHPFANFVTPDYDAVTTAIGSEVLRALRGEKTASRAIADASTAVEAIVAERT